MPFVLFACKKETGEPEPKSKPVSFAKTFYQAGCSWDANGKPDCLETPDVISGDLMNFINSTFPEGKDLRSTNPSLLSSDAIADITITEPTDVYITFVHQMTSLGNSFGYYVFPTGQAPKIPDDVKNITYVFPHLKSNVPLRPGDKVKLGRFNAGVSIGLVLLQDAWDQSTMKPKNNAVHFLSNDALNPEVDPKFKKHAVLVNYAPENKILIGWDDADRTTTNCNHDFNDVVLYATLR